MLLYRKRTNTHHENAHPPSLLWAPLLAAMSPLSAALSAAPAGLAPLLSRAGLIRGAAECRGCAAL